MRRLLALLSLSATLMPTLYADDGASSIAAGGIIVMKREPRVVMAKEVLRISPTRILVDYDFRNDSDDDVKTFVAFPVPAYGFGESEGVFGDPAFKNFRLLVDGKEKNFEIEVRAFVGKRDITALLKREHIDAVTFGHFDEKQHDYGTPAPDFQRANPASRQRLIAEGAFKDGEPNWKIEKKYYWTQTFPAHQTTHIEHRYPPVLGGTNSVRYGLEAKKLPRPTDDAKYVAREIESLCLEPKLQTKLLALSAQNDMSVPFNYVDFILTTANTWKMPIEDFTLIVDRPAPDKSIVSNPTTTPRRNEALVSFCWNGPIEKTDATHFTAHITNFIPAKELRIGFIHVDQEDPEAY